MEEVVYLEMEPENYFGNEISVTIHYKKSVKPTAEWLKYEIEALLEGDSCNYENTKHYKF